MKKKIIIVCGDPNSINTEIIYKTWKKLNSSIKERLFLIGNYDLVKSQLRKITKSNIVIKIEKEKSISSQKLKVINIPLKFQNSYKIPIKEASKYVKKSLRTKARKELVYVFFIGYRFGKERNPLVNKIAKIISSF